MRGRGDTRPLLRYLAIGALSILIDVGLLYVLHAMLEVPLAPATATAFLTSLIVNFALNRASMLDRRIGGMGRHAVRYAALVVVNLAITVLVVSGAGQFGVPYLLAKIAVVAASTCWNFVLYRRWVFVPADSTSKLPGRAAQP